MSVGVDLNARFSSGWGAVQESLVPIVGSALFWAWGFAWAFGGSDDGMPRAYTDLAYLVSMVSYVVTAALLFFAFTRGRTTHTRGAVAAFTVLISLATVVQVTAPALASDSSVLTVLSALVGVANGAGLVFLAIAWGARFCTIERYSGIMMTISFMIAYLLNASIGVVPSQVVAAVLPLLPIASTALWAADLRSSADEGDSAGAAAKPVRNVLEGGASPAFLPWKVILVLSTVGLLANFFNGAPTGEAASLSTVFLFAVAFCAVYLFMLVRSRPQANVRDAHLVLLPVTTLALLLVVHLDGDVSRLSCSLFLGGAFFLHVAIWVQLAQASVIHGLAPLVSFGVGGILVTALQFVGVVGYRILDEAGIATPEYLSLYALASVVLLMTAIVLLFRESDATAASAKIEEKRARTIEEAVVDFGADYGLTGREREVLKYFVAGRNIPYIAEALSVTAGTVKTHSSHIFSKTGTSSRQELLDLFERYRG